MRLLLQRVSQAEVRVEGTIVGSIGPGLLLFLGIHKDDTEKEMEMLIKKTLDLRIFENKEGRFDRSLKEVEGSLLVVSQFTLYADCSKGRRPAFVEAMAPAEAEKHYEAFVARLRRELGENRVATGQFGAHMEVSLINDGPVTIWLSS